MADNNDVNGDGVTGYETTTTTMATDVNDDDNEGDDASSTGCDEGDNRNRDDGKDACASATAMTQPVVRRRHVKRQRRCKEMRHDNQLARTKRRGQGWMRVAAARRKVTRGGKNATTGNATTSRRTRDKREERRQQTRGLDRPRLRV